MSIVKLELTEPYRTNNYKCFEMYLTVIAGIMIHISIGALQSWGILQIYAVSYFHITDPTVSVDELYPGLSIMTILLGIMILVTPFMMSYIHPKVIILFGGLILTIGNYLSILMPNLTLFMYVYTLSTGIGSGLLYMPPIVCAWEIAPDYKGLISGIIIGAFGLSGLLFNYLIVRFTNPFHEEPAHDNTNNEKFYPENIASNVPNMFKNISMMYFVMTQIGNLILVRKSKNNNSNKPENQTIYPIEIINNTSELNIHKYGISSKLKIEYLSNKSFYVPFILNGLTLLMGLFMIGMYNTVGVSLGYTMSLLYIISLIGPLTNFFGRILMALAVENIGFRYSYLIVTMTQILCSILLHLESDWLYVVSCLILFLTYGCHFTCSQVFFTQIYNPMTSSYVYGFFSISNIVGNVANISMKNLYANYGFLFMIKIYALLNAVGTLILIFIDLNPKELKEELLTFREKEYIAE